MMTQSIPTQASGILLGAAGSANFLAKRSRENDFDLIFANNINRETKIPVKAKNIYENTMNIKSQSKNQSADGKEKITGAMKNENAMKSEASNTDNQTVDNVTKQEQKSNDFINADLLGQIMTMFDQIRNVIMDELDLTAEELDSMMKALGLEISDLTKPQAIISLVLADSGKSDPFAMLLDEQLGNKVQGLLAKLEDVKSGANLKLTDDEIKLILEQTLKGEDNQELVSTDEVQAMQPQPVSKKAEDENGKTANDTDKFQVVSEDDSQSVDQRPVMAASNDDSQLNDTNDRRAKTDKTDGFEAFLDKLSSNYDKPIVDFNKSTVRLYDVREIAQQIIEQIRVLINPEKTTMELQLYPEHLGKVNLTVSAKEGVMTAHFAVENELAREAIESQLITLKDTLAQQGIKVETIDVTVASYTFDQKSPSDDDTGQTMHKKQRNGHKITFEEAVAMSEEPIEETDTINLTGTMGYNIDYTA
ncbi:MAG: flagellar hook-length control protein FliK [Clostridiales bacterium]|jgi:flagellar hook-length control protein FliK|nr:flagellar hook-length control protein FliK [Clostridiales bacterium]